MIEKMKNVVRLNPECVNCMLKKRLDYNPEGFSREKRIEYMQRMMKIISEAPVYAGAPVVVKDLEKLDLEMFGSGKDYAQIKKYFNELMLLKEAAMERRLEGVDDKLKLAVQFAMMGNYIDFGALESVDESKLESFLNGAKEISIDPKTYNVLKKDLQKADRIVYATDNCGEIVTDKTLIRVIKEINPKVEITVLVRGKDVINDATVEDAVQVGLIELVHVVGNGSGIAGTWIPDLSEEARHFLEEADVIIAKGQGNFETLQMCGLNVYYIFMCKCDMFAERFRVPRFSGMLVNDKSLFPVV